MTQKTEKSALELQFKDALSSGVCSSVLSQEHAQYSTTYDLCQSGNAEVDAKFTPKKSKSLHLAQSYKRLGYSSKYARVLTCGSYLEFGCEIDDNGVVSNTQKLHAANFCKDRLCPMCSWRRSYKVFAQVSQVMDKIGTGYEFLFLTLTVPSVPDAELDSTLDRMFRAWTSLTKNKRFSVAVKGYFRALEITRNNDPGAKAYGLFHPHFHVVLAVNKRYFKSAEYLTHTEWLDLWRKAYKDYSITQVDVRRAKSKFDVTDGIQASKALASAVAEIAKYAVKDSDYIFPDNDALTDSIVFPLAYCLKRRRYTAFGGVFKRAFQELNLDDAEDGDLVHLDGSINPTVSLLILRYGWSAGYYRLTDVLTRVPGSDPE